MAFHWPEPERTADLAAGMHQMRERMLCVPGCVEVDPPYLSEDQTCLIGISKWESKEAFVAAGLPLGGEDEIFPGETRPRERFLLEQVALAGPT